MTAISPAPSNSEETLGTLRFASSVKKIQTKATKNEEKDEDLVKELRAEIERLKRGLKRTDTGSLDLTDEGSKEAHEQLKLNEELHSKLGTDYEAKLKEAEELEAARAEAMEDMGLTLDEITAVSGLDKD